MKASLVVSERASMRCLKMIGTVTFAPLAATRQDSAKITLHFAGPDVGIRVLRVSQSWRLPVSGQEVRWRRSGAWIFG